MKNLTIKIKFPDDFTVIPECLRIEQKLGGGIITASARYDLFEVENIAKGGLANLEPYEANEILEDMDVVQGKE